MYGVIPYTHRGLRLFSYCQHGDSLADMQAFAQGVQEFTVATVPFVETRDRSILEIAPPDQTGYSFHHKVIITIKVDGKRYGFPIYGPRAAILEEQDIRTGRGIRKAKKVSKFWGDYFASIYPADDAEFETGWLCR